MQRLGGVWCTWGLSPSQPCWSEATPSGWGGRFKGRMSTVFWGPFEPSQSICTLFWWQMGSHFQEGEWLSNMWVLGNVRWLLWGGQIHGREAGDQQSRQESCHIPGRGESVLSSWPPQMMSSTDDVTHKDLQAQPVMESSPSEHHSACDSVSTAGPIWAQNMAWGQYSFAELITELLSSPKEQMDPNHPLGQLALQLFLYPGRKPKLKRGYMTCPGLHSWWETELGFEFISVHSQGSRSFVGTVCFQNYLTT